MNKQSTNQKSNSTTSRRFVGGAGVGLFLALIYWSYCAYFQTDFSPIHGILGSLILMLACGAISATTSLEKLFDNFPNL